jgi:hypothetical protein
MAEEPLPSELLWPDEKRGPWRVTIWWRTQHAEAVPVGFAMRPWVEDAFAHFEWRGVLPFGAADVEFPTIDSQLMKGLPVGRLVEASRRQLLAELERAEEDPPADLPEGFRNVLRDIRRDLLASTESDRRALQQPRRGRDLGEDHYREVAQVYAQAAHEGRPPTAAVAEHFSVSKSAAAKKVARARDPRRGYLPPTTRGRVGHLAEDL